MRDAQFERELQLAREQMGLLIGGMVARVARMLVRSVARRSRAASPPGGAAALQEDKRA